MNTPTRFLIRPSALALALWSLAQAAAAAPPPPPPGKPLPPAMTPTTLPAPPTPLRPAPQPPTPPAPPAATTAPDTVVATTSGPSGAVNTANPFFQPLGNGRSCASCHQPDQGWSITPTALQKRFTDSSGNDPVFRLVDGANSPAERTATLAQKQQAYGMLLRYGVIRVGLPMPAVADFTLQQVEDPYGYASAQELSLFRRPLPSTNLRFLSTVMWDARETQTGTANCLKEPSPARCFADLPTDLLRQANNAVKGHAQFTPGLSNAQLQAIVDFESKLVTAKANSAAAGSLTANGALGGTAALAATPFWFSINDPVAGDYRTGAPFNPNVFTLFNAWAPAFPGGPSPAGLTAAQAAIGRGQMIFNTRPMLISEVNGFNDALGKPVVKGTCSSCHNAPNVGGASVPRLMNTGLSAAVLRTPDMPLYTLRNAATGAVLQVTDPGLALQTGKWGDVGKLEVPGLRGLAARAPYFHNGHAPDLRAVVGFYDRRFGMGLSPQEAEDLTAFLRAL